MIPSKTVIVIAGPTAAGKTAVSLDLADRLHTQIISADSRQCFRELNIGVAKPATAELQRIPHYFIDSNNIYDEVNAALYERWALAWADEIFSNHAVTIIVGGTGLYLKAFCDGLDAVPAVSENLRRQIQEDYAQGGIAVLQDRIKLLDPLFFAEGEIQNPQRLMRALEVVQSSGRSILSFRGEPKKERPFRIIKFGILVPMPELYARINARVDEMMERGLLAEAESLYSARALNALQTVGYRELFDYMEGKMSLDEAVEQIRINTRHYAKRQMTWFRKDPDINWVTPEYLDTFKI